MPTKSSYRRTYSTGLHGKTRLVLAFTLLDILFVSILLNVAFAVDPVISIIPQTSYVTAGQVFQVNATITGAANVYGWEFKLFFRNAILNCTGVVEGSFLKNFGGTSFIKQINNAYNSTHGRLLLACSLHGDASASGSGVLTVMTFRARRNGNSQLDLVDTKLLDTSIPPLRIPHSAIDGTVQVTGDLHDVAVIGITTSKSGSTQKPVVGQGSTVRINVTVANNGDFLESFSITTYANSTPINTTSVLNLPSGAQATVPLKWSTTGFGYGNYTLSVQASPVPDEDYIDDNTLVDGVLLVSIPGDVDGNFVVSIFDVVKITACYGKKRGDLLYNPNADLDDNDAINIFDVVMCTGNYGKKYP